MGYSSVQSAIETAFLTAWGATTPVDSENMQVDPQSLSEWVRFVVTDGPAKQISIGIAAARFRYHGIVTVQVFVRPDIGVGRALVLADIVTPIFRAQRIGGVQFDVPVVVRIGTRDGWYQLNVDCPFYREE